VQSLLFALPDLQPQAERGWEMTIHGSSFDEDHRMIDAPKNEAKVCTASIPLPDPDDGSHDMGCTLPTGHGGKHICECGVMWTPRESDPQAKLDAIRALADDYRSWMEPVSWRAAIREILDGGVR
jgi:hypothetical protein